MRENIIINKYHSGLGNQMFQYAFGLNLEKKGKTVLADTLWYENEDRLQRGFWLEDIFAIKLHRDEKIVEKFNACYASRRFGTKVLNRLFPSTRKIYFEVNPFLYDERALKTNKSAVCGFWQCYRYVQNVSEKIRRDFIFTNDLPLELQEVRKNIENCNAVFIHLRGGDYIDDAINRNLYGNICTPNYYNKAVSMMKSRLDEPIFYVFTNDRKYAQSILGKNEVNHISDYIGTAYEDWIDMMLMSKCKHAIIANSTFSWWGAWLMENKKKVVIAPKKWMNNWRDTDICEPDWIRL